MSSIGSIIKQFPKGRAYSKKWLPSVTVPDQSLTVREIFERFTRGQGVQGAKSVYYDETEEVDETLAPDFDLSDVTRISQEIADNQRNIRAQAKAEADAKAKAAAVAAATFSDKADDEGGSRKSAVAKQRGKAKPEAEAEE